MKYLLIAIIVAVLIVIALGAYCALVVASRADDEHEETVASNENRCVCCNKTIPEGRQVCSDCENGGKNE